MSRYVRISDETFEAAKEMIREGSSIAKAAESLGIGSAGLWYRLNRADPYKSTRQRIIEALKKSDYTDTLALLEAIRDGTSINGHEVQHILYSLQKQGLVSFNVNKKTNNQKTLENIKASSSLRRSEPITEVKVKEEKQVIKPVVVIEEPQPTVEETVVEAAVEETWPELDRIREINKRREEAKAYVAVLVEAATALAAFDEEESSRLETKAVTLFENLKLSPVEFEYLRFAERFK